jgi:hypothetical protein
MRLSVAVAGVIAAMGVSAPAQAVPFRIEFSGNTFSNANTAVAFVSPPRVRGSLIVDPDLVGPATVITTTTPNGASYGGAILNFEIGFTDVNGLPIGPTARYNRAGDPAGDRGRSNVLNDTLPGNTQTNRRSSSTPRTISPTFNSRFPPARQPQRRQHW